MLGNCSSVCTSQRFGLCIRLHTKPPPPQRPRRRHRPHAFRPRHLPLRPPPAHHPPRPLPHMAPLASHAHERPHHLRALELPSFIPHRYPTPPSQPLPVPNPFRAADSAVRQDQHQRRHSSPPQLHFRPGVELSAGGVFGVCEEEGGGGGGF